MERPTTPRPGTPRSGLAAVFTAPQPPASPRPGSARPQSPRAAGAPASAECATGHGPSALRARPEPRQKTEPDRARIERAAALLFPCRSALLEPAMPRIRFPLIDLAAQRIALMERPLRCHLRPPLPLTGNQRATICTYMMEGCAQRAGVDIHQRNRAL